MAVTLLQFLACLICANLVLAAPCPRLCTCHGEQNLHVDCSNHQLMTPPVTSRSTLTLDLSHTALGPIINDSFPQMPNLTYIDLSHNALSRLLGCTLSGMLKLKTVRLHSNRLTSLPDSLFTDANKVEHLDISHNLFTQLPDDAFRNLQELKSLDLSHNHLVDITLGPRFQVPRIIEKIDFSHNPIQAINADTFDMASGWEIGIDRTISLAYCHISHLQAQSLTKIPNLNDLDLSGNSDVSLDNITNLVKELETRGLERLSLAHMNLSTIEPFFPQVTLMALKFLNVSFNNIDDIPANIFSTIRSLRVLDVSHNSLTQLSAGFSDLVNLRILNVSHNQMETFEGDPVPNLSKLEILDVAYNKLANPSRVRFSTFTKLTYLDANNNLLTAVVVPSNTSNLRYLDVHSNSITEFFGLDDALHLDNFDISDNDLTTVAPFLFKGGRYVKVANFSRNSITKLDHRAFLPQSPLSIDLSHNFLTQIQFSNWVATQQLFLNDNELSHIDIQTFYGMTGLKKLDLSENQLTTLHEDLFEYLTELQQLNVSFNQLDKAAWFDLFRNLAHLENLDLSHNNISHLNESMLLPLPKIQVLSLRNNRLDTIIPRVFRDLSMIKSIDLSNNPFHCGCDMLAFRDWLTRTKTEIPGLYQINSTAYQCKSPSERVGVHLTKWTEEEFECNKSMLYMIIFGSIGIFLIVAGVAGSGAYRLFIAWRKRKAERRRKWEEESEMRKKILKTDHVKMSSQEIAEEIRDAMKRKERLGHRQYQMEGKSNSYAPWPGGAKRKEHRQDRHGDEHVVEKARARDGDDDDRKVRKDRERKNYDRTEGNERSTRHRDEPRRGRREAEYTHTVPGPMYLDRSGVPLTRRPFEYEDHVPDRRPGRDYERGWYVDGDRRYRYVADPVRRSGPYIISQPAHTLPSRWDGVDVWGTPRVWTIQGHGRSRSQEPHWEGYMTLPPRPRDRARNDRDRTQHWRPEDRGLARYQHEVHFEDREPGRGYTRQYNNDADRRHGYATRSQSYSYLPQDRAVDKRDQRQYESIEQTRTEAGIGQRAVSQPYLADQQSSGWL